MDSTVAISEKVPHKRLL